MATYCKFSKQMIKKILKKMARHNKEMTTETKQMILRLKREGYAHRKISEIIGRDHSTITKFLKRYNERNSVENKPKTGRKKLVTERGDRVILRYSIKGNASPKHHCYTGTTPQTNTFRSPNFVSLSPNMYSPVMTNNYLCGHLNRPT
jgi:polyribonucleotide nucleotidyltransferase